MSRQTPEGKLVRYLSEHIADARIVPHTFGYMMAGTERVVQEAFMRLVKAYLKQLVMYNDVGHRTIETVVTQDMIRTEPLWEALLDLTELDRYR